MPFHPAAYPELWLLAEENWKRCDISIFVSL